MRKPNTHPPARSAIVLYIFIVEFRLFRLRLVISFRLLSFFRPPLRPSDFTRQDKVRRKETRSRWQRRRRLRVFGVHTNRCVPTSIPLLYRYYCSFNSLPFATRKNERLFHRLCRAHRLLPWGQREILASSALLNGGSCTVVGHRGTDVSFYHHYWFSYSFWACVSQRHTSSFR